MSVLRRLEVIGEIARNLQARFTTTEINLFLSSFGIVGTETQAMSKRQYVKDLLAPADNKLIESIAEELDIEVKGSLEQKLKPEGAPTTQEAKAIWGDGGFRLFISHISADKRRAHALKKEMAEYGVSCFVAHDDIDPSLEWQITIEKALNSMDALTAIITEDFSKSNWTDQEVGWGLGKGVPIIPLNRGHNPYGFMGKYQALMTKDKKAETVASELLDILRKNARTKDKMEEAYATAVVKRFVSSNSFAEANRNMEELETVKHLSQSMIRDIKKARRENSQVQNAHLVYERLDDLLARFEF